ncbi:MAG: RNA-guided endonuclease TnpB family protein [Chitinophagales bacterium]|nr:transposase [Bacteroidota bacterium]MCB9043847.1 IS200/IS605 family element transposase accessory protein TnpB [Chitinophagales bacterium]
MKHYYVSSKGEYAENPSFLQTFARKIGKLNRKSARQKKGSNRREKTKISLQKIYQKLRRKRSDYLHKLTHKIIAENSIILVENLQLKNMTKSAKGTVEQPGKNVKQKSGLNRVLLDLSVNEFVRQLEYKSRWYGRELIKVNPAYTSQTCSNCGYVAKENRKSQSEFSCARCGHSENADYNAAKNILGRGLSCYREC